MAAVALGGPDRLPKSGGGGNRGGTGTSSRRGDEKRGMGSGRGRGGGTAPNPSNSETRDGGEEGRVEGGEGSNMAGGVLFERANSHEEATASARMELNYLQRGGSALDYWKPKTQRKAKGSAASSGVGGKDITEAQRVGDERKEADREAKGNGEHVAEVQLPGTQSKLTTREGNVDTVAAKGTGAAAEVSGAPGGPVPQPQAQEVEIARGGEARTSNALQTDGPPKPSEGEETEEQRVARMKSEDEVLQKAKSIRRRMGIAGKAKSAAVAEPRRRKCHWDYVLEEMRWLAEDFLQERAWKQSVAAHLARSAKSSRRWLALPPSERQAKQTAARLSAIVGVFWQRAWTANGQPFDRDGESPRACDLPPPSTSCPPPAEEIKFSTVTEYAARVVKREMQAKSADDGNVEQQSWLFFDVSANSGGGGGAGSKEEAPGVEEQVFFFDYNQEALQAYLEQCAADEEANIADHQLRLREWQEEQEALRRAVAAAALEATAADRRAALKKAKELEKGKKLKRKGKKGGALVDSDFEDMDILGKRPRELGPDGKPKKKSKKEKAAEKKALAAQLAMGGLGGGHLIDPGMGMMHGGLMTPGLFLGDGEDSVGRRGKKGKGDRKKKGLDGALAKLPKIGSLGRSRFDKSRRKGQGMPVVEWVPWTPAEEQMLLAIVHEFGSNWFLIADVVNCGYPIKGVYRRPEQCKARLLHLQGKGQAEQKQQARAQAQAQEAGKEISRTPPVPVMTKQGARTLLQRGQPADDDLIKTHMENIVAVMRKHRELTGGNAAAVDSPDIPLPKRATPHASHADVISASQGAKTPLDLANAALALIEPPPPESEQFAAPHQMRRGPSQPTGGAPPPPSAQKQGAPI